MTGRTRAKPARVTATLPLLLGLSACGTLQAHLARTQLLGASEPDIISCMGVPAAKQYISRDQAVLQWDYAQSGTDFDVEFGLYALKLGRPGLCHAAIRFDRGRVKSVHYAGADVSPTNLDSLCGRLVQDCLEHRENTELPADFSNLAVLSGGPVKAVQ